MELKKNDQATCYIGYGDHKLWEEEKMVLNLIFHLATLTSWLTKTMKSREVGLFIFEFKHS